MSEKMMSAGRGALLLTALGAVSQALSFGYRVALSRTVGAEVMGLWQLVMSASAVLMSLTASGLTAAVNNLTARHLALGNRLGADQTLSTCLRAFFLLLVPLGTALIFASDFVSVTFLGDARTQLGLILLVPCAALTGIENCHKQFFYGAGRVVPPALTELLEQLVRAAAVLGLLALFLPQYPERTVGLIVAGMVICEVFSALILSVLYRRLVRRTGLPGPGEKPSVRRRRIASVALPVGANALLGNLLGAADAALIPQKLVEGGLDRSAAIAQLGVVHGMALPMLALPTVFLGALNLVLVPRMARAHALDRPGEVRRLASRGMSAVAVLALPSMALMAALGPDLGLLLFHQEGVGTYLVPLAAATAMGCFSSTLCGVLNGVSRQRDVAAVSLLGGAVQLGCTLALVPLPGVGMGGYAAGAVISAALELSLLLWLAARRAGVRPEVFRWLTAPGLSALLAALTGNLLLRYLKDSGVSLLPALGAVLAFFLVLYLSALRAQGVSLRAVLRLDR